MKLVLEQLPATGGVRAMAQRNIAKAAILYDFLETSRLFRYRYTTGGVSRFCSVIGNYNILTHLQAAFYNGSDSI